MEKQYKLTKQGVRALGHSRIKKQYIPRQCNHSRMRHCCHPKNCGHLICPSCDFAWDEGLIYF